MSVPALKINGLEVCYRKRTELKAQPRNPNTHSAKQVERIARAICDFGWTVPLIVDENDVVLAGHGRLLAAAKLGIEEVPTMRLSHMSPAQKKSYVIAENRLSEIAGSWDKKLLALEHEAIQLLDPGFDLTATGFEDEEIEIMLDGLQPSSDEDALEVDRSAPAISPLGDLWVLGRHRLYCGNALEEASSPSATALVALAPPAESFRKGRDLAAWLGLTPPAEIDRRQAEAGCDIEDGRENGAAAADHRQQRRRASGEQARRPCWIMAGADDGKKAAHAGDRRARQQDTADRLGCAEEG